MTTAALPPPLRVLVVDDEPLARLRLRALLQAPGGPAVDVVGEAGDAAGALAVLATLDASARDGAGAGPVATAGLPAGSAGLGELGGLDGLGGGPAGSAGGPCDLVLLDIGLPGRDGLKLAEALRAHPQPPAVVFVTAHAEHALRAFDLEAVDYLTKPVRRDRLAIALARVAQRRRPAAPRAPDAAARPPPVLVVHDRGRVLRVPAAEVLYLKAEQKYVTLVSLHGQWLLDESLGELEQRLGPGFLRVHRNAVVALAAVRSLTRRSSGDIATVPAGLGDAGAPASTGTGSVGDGDEGWALQIVNGDWLAVSRRQLAEVRAALVAPPGA